MITVVDVAKPKSTLVFGKDIDLLIWLLYYFNKGKIKNDFFFKPGNKIMFIFSTSEQL